jgi:UDP-N-acetylmuramoyl-tripeptide--D-alanyl-D-alanine ligase
VLAVVRPPRRHWRGYAALVPKAVLLARTRARRRRLPAVPIAVTGSVGKTTTKHLLAAALRTAGPTAALETGSNRARGVVATVRAAGPSTRFLVSEVGVAGAGVDTLDEILWALEPRVSVVTAVRGDHLSGFGGLEAIAREKGKAVAVLPAGGLAVLNADDPRVRELAAAAPCRVVLAGRAEDADVRIAETRADDDGLLVLRLVDGSAEHTVATQLIGTHWATSVALAFAAATRLGADPDRIAAAMAAVPRTWERLDLVTMANGARYLLDTAKATEATIGASFEAAAGVPARRRVVVLGRLWDFLEGADEEIAARVTEEALAGADEVLLYGRTAAIAPAQTLADPRVRTYSEIRRLADDLAATTGPGDLVHVLGTYTSDHLARLGLSATHDVRCWQDDCAKRLPCDRCPLLGAPRRVEECATLDP